MRISVTSLTPKLMHMPILLLQARVVYSEQQGLHSASIIGGHGRVTFEESKKHPDIKPAISSFEGWHLAFYLADFSGTFNKVEDAGLISVDHKYSDKSLHYRTL